MVTENQLNQPLTNNILKIKPSLTGKIAWRSTNIARFIPDAPPEMGETYTFSLAKGVKNREGEKLPADTLTTIEAEPFRVMGSNRRSGPNFATRQPVHYIYFNDEINPKAAAKYFVFKNKDGKEVAAKVRRATWADIESRYYRGNTWQHRFQQVKQGKKIGHEEKPDSPIPNAVVASSATPLPIGDKWYLHVLKNTPNASKSAKDLIGRNIYIGNIEPFEMRSITPYIAANKPRQIHISFNSYF